MTVELVARNLTSWPQLVRAGLLTTSYRELRRAILPCRVMTSPRRVLRSVGLLLSCAWRGGWWWRGWRSRRAGVGSGVGRGRGQRQQRVDGPRHRPVAADLDDHGLGGELIAYLFDQNRDGLGGSVSPSMKAAIVDDRGPPVLPAPGGRLAGHDPGGGGELGGG